MKNIYLFLILVCFILIACKDEITKPEESRERKLQILTYQKDCNTNECNKPVSADIKITEKDLSGNSKVVFQGTSKNDGTALYTSFSTIFGVNLSVESVFNNMLQSKNFLLCATDTTVSFCFECNPPLNVCCDQLPADTTLSGTFLNEVGSPQLVKNYPLGLGKYSLALNLFTNGCPDKDIIITVPKLDLPFQYAKIVPDAVNNKVTLKPGQTLSVIVEVLTKDAGIFTTDVNNIKFDVLCDNKPSVWRMQLDAEVIESLCECPTTTDTLFIDRTNSVPVGSTDTFNEIILTNTTDDCEYIIKSINRLSTLGAFDLTPAKNNLPSGESLEGNFKFSPKRSGINEDVFEINYTLPNGVTCKALVKITGIGCNPTACGFINGNSFGTNLIDRSGTVTFTKENCNNCPYDTTFQLVSMPNTYYDNLFITLPDSVCDSKDFSVVIEQNDHNKFDVTNTGFTVNPGGSENIGISFIAPTKLEFQKLRPNAKTAADSCFILRLRITGCGKTQLATYKVCISNFGKYSNILSLFAYNQTTYGIDDKLTYPDYKACCVNVINPGNGELGLINSLANPVGSSNAPSPGNLSSFNSDFIINPANDTDTSAQGPPQKLIAPSIQLVKNSCRYKHIKLFRANVSASQFANKTIMSNDVCAAAPGFFDKSAPRIATNVAAGDVYAIYSYDLNQNGNPCLVALIHVISVDNGSYNIERRCGISFRLFWPIDC